jgi:hypothetical protein
MKTEKILSLQAKFDSANANSSTTNTAFHVLNSQLKVS